MWIGVASMKRKVESDDQSAKFPGEKRSRVETEEELISSSSSESAGSFCSPLSSPSSSEEEGCISSDEDNAKFNELEAASSATTSPTAAASSVSLPAELPYETGYSTSAEGKVLYVGTSEDEEEEEEVEEVLVPTTELPTEIENLGARQLEVSRPSMVQMRPPPPPPPPPPVAMMFANAWSAASPNGVFVPPPPPPPPPPPHHIFGQSAFWCEVCDRDLRSRERYEVHLNEDHIGCDACEWSGPVNLLVVHKMSHLKDRHGVPVTESVSETEAWLHNRRAKRQQLMKGREELSVGGESSPDHDSSAVSDLEKYLRLTMASSSNGRSESRLNKSLIRRTQFDSGVVPHGHQYLRHFDLKRSEAINGPEMSKADAVCRIWQDFNICEAFLRHRRCRNGDNCTRSHDTRKYQEWMVNRIRSGMQVRSRAVNGSALIYKLYQSEIVQYEQFLLKVFRCLVKHEFFLQEQDGQDRDLLTPTPPELSLSS